MRQKHEKERHIYVGVDTHKNQHTAVVINCWNEKLGEITFENKPAAFSQLIAEVKKYARRSITPIYGLEDVSGYGRALATVLIEKKQIVKEVNSALSYAERKSYPTPYKSDSWDAQCVAEVLVRKFLELPDANPQDLYWTIAQLVTRRNALVKTNSALLNQLHVQLSYHYPSYRKFFSEIDGKTALTFWERYPAPHHLKDVTVNKLTSFLLEASNNTCSTKKAEHILSLVEADGHNEREYQESRDLLVRSQVRQLRENKEKIIEVDTELAKLLKLLGYQLDSMPGINTVMAASIIAEIGDIKRFASSSKLARFSGIAPLNFSSAGKGKDEKSKKQGNRVLHGIFYFLAVQQTQVSKTKKQPRNPYLYQYYHGKLAEGKTKGQAIVALMRKLVDIIYSIMKNKTVYVMPLLPEKEAV
ncbi:IS110 family transposase [Phosphitispora sp. TUW77]|uniref:IS110 family transposase n=1 Tax=Phosphitispora sp. TUW77 TaxID=3152361 RepID=UPI003AB15F84